jgi:acyl-CoA synthetase (AMP-forming)/AMP-acid ligase II
VASKLPDGCAIKKSVTVDWSASLHTLADRFEDSVAVTDGDDQRLTYRELCNQAHQLAVVLSASINDQSAITVATLLPNSINAVLATYAVRLIGATEVPISWYSTPEEIEWCATLAKVSTILTLHEKQSTLKGLGLKPVCLEDVASALKQQTAKVILPAVHAESFGRILFTSGTTGKPKGVLYRHIDRWVGEQMLKASLPFIPAVGDKVLLMTPFVHGSSLMCYAWCDYGAHVVLLDGVVIEKIREQLQDLRLRAIFAPPTVLAKITHAFAGQEFKQVECVFTGTQPLTALLYKRACAMFGPVVRITYGKSECVNPITVLSIADTQAYFSMSDLPAGACVGHPAPGVELRIEPHGETDNDRSDGEVWLKAPHMSCGMITVDGFLPHEPDGWHQTGDLGHIDASGRLVLTGRLADVIKTGGFKVNPDEIEATLSALGGATQICVTSLASDYWGEIIVAVAESAFEGWEAVALDRVKTLSRHKHPRLFITLDALPRNPQGKVGRRIVRERVLSEYALIDGPYPEIKRRPQAFE